MSYPRSKVVSVVGLVLLVGAAAGGPKDKWQEVPVDRIRLGLLPQTRGLALSFSF